MDAPYSRRALLAAGIGAGASATAGCVGRFVSDDSSSERTVAAITLTNRMDRPIELSVILRLDGRIEFWETFELTTSRLGQDHLIDGTWHAAPGDLEMIARYRVPEGVMNGSKHQINTFTLGDGGEDCTVIDVRVWSEYGIEIEADKPPTTPDGPEPCPPLSEW